MLRPSRGTRHSQRWTGAHREPPVSRRHHRGPPGSPFIDDDPRSRRVVGPWHQGSGVRLDHCALRAPAARRSGNRGLEAGCTTPARTSPAEASALAGRLPGRCHGSSMICSQAIHRQTLFTASSCQYVWTHTGSDHSVHIIVVPPPKVLDRLVPVPYGRPTPFERRTRRTDHQTGRRTETVHAELMVAAGPS